MIHVVVFRPAYLVHQQHLYPLVCLELKTQDLARRKLEQVCLDKLGLVRPSNRLARVQICFRIVLKPFKRAVSWNLQNSNSWNCHQLSETFNPLSPNCDKVNFLLTISIPCQEIRLWELMKWSLKRKCFDLLSDSLNFFFKEIYRDRFGELECGFWGLKG